MPSFHQSISIQADMILQSDPEIQNITEEEIMAEIDAYREDK